MLKNSWVVVLGLLLAGCAVDVDSGTEDEDEEAVGSVQQAYTEWPDGTYARFRDNGTLYTNHDLDDINNMTIVAAAAGSNWYTAHPERFRLLVGAMQEVNLGLCGNPARSRYNAKNDWCSEFARWTLLRYGAEDIGYCISPGPRGAGCNATWNLHHITKTSQMVVMFSHFNAFTPDYKMTETSVQPGDYLAMTGNSGRYHHSGIVMAVSWNYKWIWTAEGNYGDCVTWVKRPFFVDGKLDPMINGVGNADVLF